MTPMKTFRVRFWEHNWLEGTVRARSEHDALSKAQCRYAAASPADSKGFELLDNGSDDWDVTPASPRLRRRS
jgi:hypothetical protein